jgi:hypothetical protein
MNEFNIFNMFDTLASYNLQLHIGTQSHENGHWQKFCCTHKEIAKVWKQSKRETFLHRYPKLKFSPNISPNVVALESASFTV